MKLVGVGKESFIMDTPKDNSKKRRMSEFNPICLNAKKKNMV